MKYAVPFFDSAVSFLPIKEITGREERESVHRAKIGSKRCGGPDSLVEKLKKKVNGAQRKKITWANINWNDEEWTDQVGYFHSTRHAENAAEESDRNETLGKQNSDQTLKSCQRHKNKS